MNCHAMSNNKKTERKADAIEPTSLEVDYVFNLLDEKDCLTTSIQCDVLQGFFRSPF